MEEKQVVLIGETGKGIAQILHDAGLQEAPIKLTDEEMAALHPNMVKLPSGEWIDRSKVVFLMHQDTSNKDIFTTIDGTRYRKEKSGSMVKIGSGSTKESRKKQKKLMAAYWQLLRLQNRMKKEEQVSSQLSEVQ